MKLNLILIVMLILIVPSGFALFQYDEFTDDYNQTITETVENENGLVCTDCNVSFWLNYPNSSFRSLHMMVYNATSQKYEKIISPTLTLIDGNTTIYQITLKANRSTTTLFNGTSDRTTIIVYDTWPQVDSQWDVGLVLIFIVIQWVFLLLAYKFHEEHHMLKILFIAISLIFNILLLGVANRLAIINGATGNSFTSLLDSAQVVGLYVNFLFTAYMLLYLGYTLIHAIITTTRQIKQEAED